MDIRRLILENPCGCLDGLVLMRFTLAHRDGGGIEEHIRNVDRVLLERSQMTIIQLYVASKEEHLTTQIPKGKGRLILVPIQPNKIARSERPIVASIFLKLCPWLGEGSFRVLASKLLAAAMRVPFLRSRGGSMRFFYHEPGEIITRLFKEHLFHLAVLHSVGGLDDIEIISLLAKLGVPIATIHHYENRLLAHPLVRLILQNAAAIGGVSSIGVPRYLQHRFFRIFEGIDTDFFQVGKASPLACCDGKFLILLPARIQRAKGHLDLVEAVSLLNCEGYRVKLAFAGRTDSEATEREIVAAVNCLDDPKQAIFLGQLDQFTLRDWYASCNVVALPSYSEGLPRVLLEAQSMKRPVVAYAVGGVPESMKHGETGFLVRKGDISGLANRLREFILNESLAGRMGELGRSFVEQQFSLRRSAKSHEEFYLSALGSHRGNR
jgi:glycosyltransferase involved in cell wall biosynthesis